MSGVTTLKLNSGYEMPIIGLGTWKSKPEAVEKAVHHAIKSGYRHFDCAYAYANEHEVGRGVHKAISEGLVKREELFITSKLFNNKHHPDDVEPQLKKTLGLLGLDYLDLYLIHWPFAFRRGEELFPKDDQGCVIASDDHYLATWKAMEDCVKQGLVRSIGLSNFNSQQVQDVCDNSTIAPAVLQCECSPYLGQKELIAFCKNKGVVFTGYSPLGSTDSPSRQPYDPSLFTEPDLRAIAGKYGKSVAQVALRWNIQRGVVVIPKSVTIARIDENINVFDFELTKEDIDEVEKLNVKKWRSCWFKLAKTHKFWPFSEPF